VTIVWGGATFLPIAAYSTTNGMLYLLVSAEAIVLIAIEANWIVTQAIIQTGVSLLTHITLTCGLDGGRWTARLMGMLCASR
jgi:hypothetical protein